MQVRLTAVLLACLSFGMAGCISPVQVVLVEGRDLQTCARVPRICPDEGPSKSGPLKSPNAVYWQQVRRNIIPGGQTIRVKYHSSYQRDRWIVVQATLDNGKSYPVVVDTGASTALVVNDTHVFENRLPILPVRSRSTNDSGWGMCRLPGLTIGALTFQDWPCVYKQQHTELQFLGLPLAKADQIVAGLQMLTEFRYILFDNASENLELSMQDSFEPNQPDLWSKYPFVIEEDFSGNAFLFVSITIAGEPVNLQLDTGSGRGLALAENAWGKISAKFVGVKLKKSADLYPYIGLLPCRKATIRNLQIGNRKIDKTDISVLPDDSPVVEDCSGMLGMQCFENTAFVVDFERNLVWIRNEQPAHLRS